MTFNEMLFLASIPFVFFLFMVVIAWITYTQASHDKSGSPDKSGDRSGQATNASRRKAA
jgi:hypothetical protein